MRNNRIVALLMGAILVLPLAGGAEYLDFTPANDVPVYYLGAAGDALELENRAINVKAATQGEVPQSRHILIADGRHSVDRDFLRAEMIAGNPVIMLEETEAAKHVFEGQFDSGTLSGLTPDGRPVRETAYGYLYSPEVTKIFVTSEEDPTRAAELAHTWATESLRELNAKYVIDPGGGGGTGGGGGGDPYFSNVYQRDYSTGESWKPYGKMNVRTIYYRLVNDGTSSYDWYDVKFKHQSRPGKLQWSNNWRTADMYTWLDADDTYSSYFLSDYSPTSTQGSTSVGVSVGVSAGTDGASVSEEVSWSYSISDVVVADQSDFDIELAKWHHNVDETTNVGKNTYLAEPGACIRVSQGGSRKWREHYGAKYGEPILWWYNYTTEGWVEFS